MQIIKSIIYLLIVFGLVLLTKGGYTYAKPYLARHLLERAWQETFDGGTQIKPWPWADTWPVAKLIIPSVGIQQVVLEGDSGSVLAFGPGHMLLSAPLDKPGISVISGHRDTSFRFLKDMSPTSTIFIQKANKKYDKYVLIKTLITEDALVYLPNDSTEKLLAIVTCYPFDSQTYGGKSRFIALFKKTCISKLPRD